MYLCVCVCVVDSSLQQMLTFFQNALKIGFEIDPPIETVRSILK